MCSGLRTDCGVQTLPQPAQVLRTGGLRLEWYLTVLLWELAPTEPGQGQLWGAVNRKIHGRLEAQRERKGLGQRVSQNV